MKLLLTGGAGYIGSVLAARLVPAGHRVTVLDDLSTAHADAMPAEAQLVRGDVRAAGNYLRDHDVGAVLHLAARSLVADSVADPSAYWHQNLGGDGRLAGRDARCADPPRRFFLDGSRLRRAGKPAGNRVSSPRPANAYGGSKLAADIVLTEHTRLRGIAPVSLLYFNVAGLTATRQAAGGANRTNRKHASSPASSRPRLQPPRRSAFTGSITPPLTAPVSGTTST